MKSGFEAGQGLVQQSLCQWACCQPHIINIQCMVCVQSIVASNHVGTNAGIVQIVLDSLSKPQPATLYLGFRKST